MTESDEISTEAPSAPRAPRRRFTEAERIENREKEIADIKEKRCKRIRALIGEAKDMLFDVAAQADATGMDVEAKLCANAFAVLTGAAKVEGDGEERLEVRP